MVISALNYGHFQLYSNSQHSCCQFGFVCGNVLPDKDNIAHMFSSISELNSLHASSMDEPGVVHSINVVFLLHSRPDKFVESCDCQQRQPIQKLHERVKMSSLAQDAWSNSQVLSIYAPATWTVHALSGSTYCMRTWHSASIWQCNECSRQWFQ